jgi:hypothetical protein
MYTAQSLKDLPDKLYMNMRLFYYDDITPENYEPPGFKPCDFESYKYEQGKYKIALGSVSCLWHQLKFDINCSNTMLVHKEDFAENLDTSVSTKHTANQTIELAPLNTTDMSDEIKKEKTSQHEVNDERITKQISDLKVDNPSDPSPTNSPVSTEKKIECFCEAKLTNDMKLIKCVMCNCYQHAICFNIFVSEEAYFSAWEKNFKHYCLKCFKKLSDKSISPTDLSLVNLEKKKLLGLSVWRRALYVLSSNKGDTINTKQLAQALEIKTSQISPLLQKCERDSILECLSKKE